MPRAPSLEQILHILRRGKIERGVEDSVGRDRMLRHESLVAWVRRVVDGAERGPTREEHRATTGHTLVRDQSGELVAIVGIFPGGERRIGVPFPEARTPAGEPWHALVLRSARR